MGLDDDMPDLWYMEFPQSPRSDAGLSAASSQELHPLFHVADTLIDHIHDYPTLICLSLTCRTFYSLIHNSRTKLPVAFLDLECKIPDNRLSTAAPGMQNKSEFHSSEDCSPIEQYPPTGGYMMPSIWTDERMCHSTPWYDIFRHKHAQLWTLDWLPCYGCQRIKRRATEFFTDQTQGHYVLLACSAMDRRCITCSIWEPWRFAKPLRYMNDMPKGLAGWRLRCTNCRNVEWAVQRPRKGQELRKLCSVCWATWRNEEEPESALRREWEAMADMPIEPWAGRAKLTESDVTVVDEQDGRNELMMAGSYKSWCRFEVLDVEAG